MAKLPINPSHSLVKVYFLKGLYNIKCIHIAHHSVWVYYIRISAERGKTTYLWEIPIMNPYHILLLYYYYLRQSLYIAKDGLELAVKPRLELRILLPHPTKLLGTGSLIFKCY